MREWWPDPPPSNEAILDEMFHERFEAYRRDHWLLKSKKDLKLIRRMNKRRVTSHQVRHLQSRNRSQMLNQFLTLNAQQYKDAPGRLSSHIMRNGIAGIGHTNKALRRLPLALACGWTSTGCDSRLPK